MILDPNRIVQPDATTPDSRDPLVQRAYMAHALAQTDPLAAVGALTKLVLDLLPRVQAAHDTAHRARLIGEAVCHSVEDLAGQLHPSPQVLRAVESVSLTLRALERYDLDGRPLDAVARDARETLSAAFPHLRSEQVQ